MWKDNARVREILLRKELACPLAKIAKTRPLRFWFDSTFIHEGGLEHNEGEGTPWHHDVSAFGLKGELLPSLWMALTPTDEDRSRLLFIDRSDKATPGYLRSPLQVGGKPPDDGYLDVPDMDARVAAGTETILTWDGEPGDGIVIHPFTVHGAYGNRGRDLNSSRIAIITRWLGDDARWVPTTYGGLKNPRPQRGHHPEPGPTHERRVSAGLGRGAVTPTANIVLRRFP